MRVYDIIIIGGGLVGAGFASALRGSHLRVALVDAREPTNDDPRLFALNAGSCEFLENIGVWPAIVADAAPIKQVHVSSRGHFGAARLKSEDADLPFLGYVIPAYVIETALNHQMTLNPEYDVYRPATLHALTQKEDGVSLVLSTPTGDVNLQAGLVIGADGTESSVRKLAGIAAETVDYQQRAIVTRTTLARSHCNIAYERFTNNGTIAMLPLSGNECATIWSGNHSVIDELMQMSDGDFLQKLQQQFGYRLGRLQFIKQRHTFPLRMMQAKTMTTGHIFLLGNAAHTLHPVAAQGFNLALYEVAVLVETLLNVKKAGRAVAAVDLQAAYATIKQQQSMSITVSHQLATRFSVEKSAIRKLVPFGLLGFDLMTPLRQRFVRKMMGRSGRVPRLLMSVMA